LRELLRWCLPSLLIGLVCALLLVLLAVLLLTESPYYFGLGDVHPALAWLPLCMLALVGGLFLCVRKGLVPRPWFTATVVLVLPMVGLLGYWGLLWP
ncbi:MAG TPA: hypothetical protein PLP28_09855, partial [Flavobacteriales bacterium]|nr:hypothetical protein [Flavobacteriales bacterium]